ncbi:efflux transporter outer membrane subunit [Xylophilus sp. GOD-11R]|uniref:efflux transporter outer membrane subunit n=1 Tax=Xylophilus sp. GOD-11R TaxID=3089814 RepID=UPI00298CC2F5|nr:efflux transporter outer membrane subunit [Xylophilus sp. GOD-11R]WPB57843.1 efflux transporter outer membrane subunit [Xylophilus sp. GOD-11R]
MRTKQLRLAAIPAIPLVAALVLAGCATGSKEPYQSAAINVPATWAHGSVAKPSVDPTTGVVTAPRDIQALTGRWWTAFGDPTLDQLVDAAIARNNDLAAAGFRVRAAQLQAGIAQANLRPTLSGGLNTGVSRALDGGPSSRTNTLSLGASYEVDLWNRLGSLRDIAQWEAQATEQDRESSAQALAGTTATLYWQLRYLGQRVAVAQSSTAYAERTLALVQTQFTAGSVSPLEVAEARQTVSSQRAALALLEQQRVEAGNALALLFDGTLPPVFGEIAQALPTGALPAIPEGVPADVLARRPDLRAAELRLRGSLTTIAATRASYYPALTLTGALGGSSTSLANVLQNPIATLGAGLSMPFLQYRQMDLNIRISQAQYEEAVVSYRQTLYQALADVDNALSARSRYAEQGEQLQAQLDDARTAERLYETRYRLGAVALRIWLDAQESRRAAETALALNRYNRLVNHATLLRVLGGEV